ncbi:MAG: hypothetical protein UT05_C0001G0048 [Parcubacteria group bacterium GW2011_GWF2_38_76]|nr:MAG: hypothetical protein UT05_C0001G0048 [Parcubacteria group bacterium GW2011_GWF2_38_76]HBM45975.1 hypothetical protein [Patescibacteria group bacterium]
MKIVLSLIIVFVIFYFGYFAINIYFAIPICGQYVSKEITVGEKNITVELADNDCKRELGLSGRTSLGKKQGMLFVYQNDGSRGIWMKDMKFPIDILWINKDTEVVGIEWAITPETYPKIFGEAYEAAFVLELPVGFIKENYISLGSKISIK